MMTHVKITASPIYNLNKTNSHRIKRIVISFYVCRFQKDGIFIIEMQ